MAAVVSLAFLGHRYGVLYQLDDEVVLAVRHTDLAYHLLFQQLRVLILELSYDVLVQEQRPDSQVRRGEVSVEACLLYYVPNHQLLNYYGPKLSLNQIINIKSRSGLIPRIPPLRSHRDGPRRVQVWVLRRHSARLFGFYASNQYSCFNFCLCRCQVHASCS